MVEKAKNNVIEVQPIKTDWIKVEADLALGMLSSAERVEIENQAQYEYAADCLKGVKAKAKELDTKRKAITGPIDMAKKAVMDLFRKPTEDLDKAERLLKKGMLAYTEEQERKRREQEEKLQKQAEAERRRKEKQQRAWEEKERKKREEAEKFAAEGKAEEARKAEAEAEKAAEKAAEREEEASQVQAPILASNTEQPKGVSYRSKWTAEIIDLSKVPVEYLLPNMPMLNKVAQTTKGALVIPGVTFKEEKIVASGM